MQDNLPLPEGYTVRYDNYTGKPYAAKVDPDPAPLPPEADAPSAEMPYAGFWPRLAAYGIDMLLAGLLFGLLRVVSFFMPAVLFRYSAADLLFFLLVRLYFILFTKGLGATPGKLLLRLRVTDEAGAAPSWWAVIYRETVGRYLSSLLFAGYIALAFDSQHRGFHDRLADTRVLLR